MSREGGDRRYEVRFFRYGAALFGIVPAGDLVALCEAWKNDFGYDEVDAKIAQALGATFVAGKTEDLRTWRAVIEADKARPDAPRFGDPLNEDLESYGDSTKENPHRYVVNLGLCQAILAGRWNTGMLDAVAGWARERILRDVAEDKIRRLERRALDLEDETPTQPLKMVRFRFDQDHYWNGRTYRKGEILHLHPVAARILVDAKVGEVLKIDE